MSYYNPKMKDANYHYRYIGEKDNGETKKIRIALSKRSLIDDPFIPVMKIVGEIGIEDMLKKHLTETECKEIITISVSKTVRPLVVSLIDTWFGGISPFRTMNVEMKSQRISELLERIG